MLFNSIDGWSKKAAAFFLQRRPRVALFVEHHLAATSLPREKEVWERHGYRLFMEPAQAMGNGKGTTGGAGAMCEKGLMAGEFLQAELQPLFDEPTISCGQVLAGNLDSLARVHTPARGSSPSAKFRSSWREHEAVGHALGIFCPLPSFRGLSWATGIVNSRICS